MNLFHSVKNGMHKNTLLNINKWITLNDDIIFNRIIYSDNDCIKYLEHFDKKYNFDTLKWFIYEQDGRFKCCLWRMCILYEYGGLYNDIDQELLVPIRKWLDFDKIDFCTGLSAPSNYVYNGIIYCKHPESPILKDCIKLHIEKYRNNCEGIAGTHTMCEVIRGYFKDNFIPHGEVNVQNHKCLFLREIPDWSLEKIHYGAFLNSHGLYTNNDTLKIGRAHV